jgi:16S rRNA (guanine966-N2)-methyltransferase
LSATLVDHSDLAHKNLEKLLLVLELENCTNLCLDAEKLISKKNSSSPYSIIFLDPPYGVYEHSELIEKLYKNKWADETTLIYCESGRPIKIDENSKHYIFKESRAGEVYYALIKS